MKKNQAKSILQGILDIIEEVNKNITEQLGVRGSLILCLQDDTEQKNRIRRRETTHEKMRIAHPHSWDETSVMSKAGAP